MYSGRASKHIDGGGDAGSRPLLQHDIDLGALLCLAGKGGRAAVGERQLSPACIPSARSLLHHETNLGT